MTSHLRSLVTYLFRTTGQVLGVSLSGTILQAVLTKKLQERIQGPNAMQVLNFRPSDFQKSNFLLRKDHWHDTVNKLAASTYFEMLFIHGTCSHSTEVIKTLDPINRQAAADSYADALRVVFICQGAMNVLVLLASLPIQENPLP